MQKILNGRLYAVTKLICTLAPCGESLDSKGKSKKISPKSKGMSKGPNKSKGKSTGNNTNKCKETNRKA